MEISPQPVPPRTMNVPQTPQPQTCFGILNDSGFPSGQENVTDVPPDFGWMSSIEQYIGSFNYSIATIPGAVLQTIYPQAKRTANITRPTQEKSDYRAYIQWHYIPFYSSRWWSGDITIRLMAIKPPRATGKIIIRYLPDPTWDPQQREDKNFRSIKMEWDLGQSSEFIFDVPALNISSLRPTWLPRFSNLDNVSADQDKKWVNWSLAVPQWSFGIIQVVPAQSYQPGSLFPDSVRILVFQSFKNAQFYTVTDPRSASLHTFNSFTPLAVEEKTPYAYYGPI